MPSSDASEPMTPHPLTVFATAPEVPPAKKLMMKSFDILLILKKGNEKK
jgi:hypothetical protein